MNQLSVETISKHNLEDIRNLLGSPAEGWCWCVAWEVDTWDDWGGRSEQQNRELREKLWSEGKYFGYLFYLDDDPVGWCRVGPANEWPKLLRTRLQGFPPESVVFTCFNIAKPHRGMGLMHRFFSLVLEELRNQGVGECFGIPKLFEDGVSCGAVWTGPKGMFDKAGFTVIRENGNELVMHKKM